MSGSGIFFFVHTDMHFGFKTQHCFCVFESSLLPMTFIFLISLSLENNNVSNGSREYIFHNKLVIVILVHEKKYIY